MYRAVALLLALLVCASPADAETGFLDRAVAVAGETYRYQVYVPREHTATTQWPIVLWLHGAGQRGDDGLRQTEGSIGTAVRLNRERVPALIVIPQARPGHLWDSAMQTQAVAALDAATREFNGDPDRTYLMGFSMGGRGAWSLASRHPQRFVAMVIIAGPPANVPDTWSVSERETFLRENDFVRSSDPFVALAPRLKHLPLRLFHGLADTVAPIEQSRRMAAALRQVGADVQLTEYEGVGHDPAPVRALTQQELWTWLLGQRRQPK